MFNNILKTREKEIYKQGTINDNQAQTIKNLKESCRSLKTEKQKLEKSAKKKAEKVKEPDNINVNVQPKSSLMTAASSGTPSYTPPGNPSDPGSFLERNDGEQEVLANVTTSNTFDSLATASESSSVSFPTVLPVCSTVIHLGSSTCSPSACPSLPPPP